MKFQLPYYIIKYKKFLVPLMFVLLAIFMIFVIIIPQFSTLSSLNQQISAQEEQLATLKNSISVVSSQSDETLDDQVNTATLALPTGKDVSKIFSALSAAAASSGTIIEEFSLSVGGIYGRAARFTSTVVGTPSLSVAARVQGPSPKDLTNFAKELQKTLPLAEVKKMDISDGLASFQVNFFYKPVDLSVIAKQENVVAPGQSSINLLNQFKEWNQ